MPEIIYSQVEPSAPAEFIIGKRRVYPFPSSCRLAKTASNGEVLQTLPLYIYIKQDELKIPLQVAYPQEEDRKINAKMTHFAPHPGRQNI